jgi:hypothetical protein
MALGFYFKPQTFTPAQYDETIQQLEAAGAGAPAGRVHHCALLGTDGMIQVFDIWESQEAFDKFGETLLPIMAQLGSDPGAPMVNEIHNTIAG